MEKLPGEEKAKLQERLDESDIAVAKMRTRLKVFFKYAGGGMPQSMGVLGYMCQKHCNQIRKNGEQYIVHPLSMACRAEALGVLDDELFATILLHDVVEDTNAKLEDLPASEEVKKAVKLMTFDWPRRTTSLSSPCLKSQAKREYYENLAQNKTALLCKGFDRWDNLGTMTALSKRAIRKNVLETSIWLLPKLEKAKNDWPEDSDMMFLVRGEIKISMLMLAHYNEVNDLTDEVELIRLIDDESYLKDSK
ncbi:hypothetical protein IJJ18_00830 [Candidatus Saccharibacteria bacterium]|nr:hypothetical protein [Candidatus Saccharibacteria bacterium]